MLPAYSFPDCTACTQGKRTQKRKEGKENKARTRARLLCNFHTRRAMTKAVSLAHLLCCAVVACVLALCSPAQAQTSSSSSSSITSISSSSSSDLSDSNFSYSNFSSSSSSEERAKMPRWELVLIVVACCVVVPGVLVAIVLLLRRPRAQYKYVTDKVCPHTSLFLAITRCFVSHTCSGVPNSWTASSWRTTAAPPHPPPRTRKATTASRSRCDQRRFFALFFL